MSGRDSVSQKRLSSIKHIKNEELSATYDYVLVFPMVGEPGQMKQSNHAKHSVSEMNKAGLETFSYLSVQSDELIVLVRCPVSSNSSGFDLNSKVDLSPMPCNSTA
jgi:hypothetical protein